MMRCRSIAIAALANLAATSAGAAGDEAGRTSTGTLSISITIAPHVRVDSKTIASSGDAGGFCVSDSGIRNYHIGILSPGASAPVALPVSAIGGPCGSVAAAGAELLADALAGPGRPSSGSLTLLVTPD